MLPHQKIENTNYKYSDKSDNNWNVHHFTVKLVTTDPIAEVFAPPAVSVTTPAEVIVPAKEPATPPDIVKTSPYAGISATTPEVTSTPEPIAFTLSPAVKLSLKLKAAPVVLISYVPGSSVAAVFPEGANNLPK